MNDLKKLKVLDLFSGCGGLSNGFMKAGYEVLLGIDNWELSLQTFKRNHKGSNVFDADLSQTSAKEVDEKFELTNLGVDVIIGGPPCQGFSISGKRDINDPRNRLYKSFVNYVAYFKPRAFIIENVPNILSMDGGSVKNSILSDFEKIGYTINYKILLASDFGVPQNRRRAFFVGLLDGKKFDFPAVTHGEKKSLLPRVTSSDAISDLTDHDLEDGARYPSKPHSEYQKLMRLGSEVVFGHHAVVHSERTRQIIDLVPDGGNYKDLPVHLQGTRKVNIAWTRYSSSKPSPTIDTGHNHHFHYKYNRVPTPRESARLQSFDDTYIFSGRKNEQLKQIGNAVPPLLAKAIALELRKYL